MADVFISYAREDHDFVRALHDALRATEREIWVDWEGIPPSAEWMTEIHAAIESAPSFVFVISPDSVTSRVCGQELDHAALHSKRIIVVVRRDPEDDGGRSLPVPDAASKINWIFGREADSFDEAVLQVVESLDTDLEHVRAHARLTVRAVEWDASGGEAGFLLRGRDLESARRWLAESEGKEPEPSSLHREYITTSRQAAAEAAAGRALVGFPDDPELGVLLATTAATELASTPATLFAARVALAASPLRAELGGHEGEVTAAEWSPDGARLVTTSEDGSARVWDAHTGSEVSAFLGHDAPLAAVAWSPDGAWIASGSKDGTVRVWDPATGSERAVLRDDRLEEEIVGVAWSADGRRVLTAPKKGNTAVWDLEDGPEGSPLWMGQSRWLVAARWNLLTNRVLLLTGNEGVVIFEAASGEGLFGLRLPQRGVREGAWSPDGSLIATSKGRSAHVWGGEDGGSISEIVGHESDITSLAFDPASKRLATASTDRTVRTWDPRTGDELRRMTRHEDSVISVAWSPDGSRLLTAGADGTARVWDAALERQVAEFRQRPSPEGGSWAPDGTRVVTFGADGCRVYAAYPGDWSFGFVNPTLLASDGAEWARTTGTDALLLCRWMSGGSSILTVWRSGCAELHDGAAGRPTVAWQTGEPLVDATPSPDGRSLLMTDRSGLARIRDLGSGSELPPLAGLDGGLVSALWSPEGDRVLGVFSDGRTSAWDAGTGARLAEAKPRRAPQPGEDPAAAWSRDGRRFLTYLYFSQSEAVLLWDAETGEELAYLPPADLSQLWSAEWSPDGRWIVIVAGDIRLVDPDSGEVARVLDPGEHFFSPGIVWSPQGDRVLVGLESGLAKIWDMASDDAPLVLSGHDDRVQFGVWSRDGQQVVTVSDDPTARVWNTDGGELIATLQGHEGPLHDAHWSGDERLILTRSADHSARIWDAGTGDPVVSIGGVDDRVEEAQWHPEAPRVLVRTASGAWVWDVETRVKELLARAGARVSRKLTEGERRSYGLPVAVPD